MRGEREFVKRKRGEKKNTGELVSCKAPTLFLGVFFLGLLDEGRKRTRGRIEVERVEKLSTTLAPD